MAANSGSGINKFWGTILSAVGDRASTADIWGAMRDVAQANPDSIKGITIQDVNAFRSAAAGIRRASEAFAGAAATDAITSDMVAQTPFSADLGAQAVSPVYNVSFERTFLDEDGIEETEMRTDRFVGGLPGTVQDLIDTMSTDMDTFYGGTTTGIGTVSIQMGR